MEDEISKIAVGDFEKKPDGSWVCVKNSDITAKSGKIMRIAPTTTFKKGGRFLGFDIVEALEKASAK